MSRNTIAKYFSLPNFLWWDAIKFEDRIAFLWIISCGNHGNHFSSPLKRSSKKSQLFDISRNFFRGHLTTLATWFYYHFWRIFQASNEKDEENPKQQHKYEKGLNFNWMLRDIFDLITRFSIPKTYSHHSSIKWNSQSLCELLCVPSVRRNSKSFLIIKL